MLDRGDRTKVEFSDRARGFLIIGLLILQFVMLIIAYQ